MYGAFNEIEAISSPITTPTQIRLRKYICIRSGCRALQSKVKVQWLSSRLIFDCLWGFHRPCSSIAVLYHLLVKTSLLYLARWLQLWRTQGKSENFIHDYLDSGYADSLALCGQLSCRRLNRHMRGELREADRFNSVRRSTSYMEYIRTISNF